ncbi:MAG: hypothetical protein K8L99_11880 [Anaerolineae bacterium]|nr:hypothetical protein [Anaerolineae bacterium]
MSFVEEQHGVGPVHFACEINNVVIELYPQNKKGFTSNLMLGFEVSSFENTLAALAKLDYVPKSPPQNGRCIVLDPDQNQVMLTSNPVQSI